MFGRGGVQFVGCDPLFMCRTCDDADLSVQHVLRIVPWLILAIVTI